MRRLAIVFLLFLIAALTISWIVQFRSKLPADLKGKIIGVVDGDTVDLLYDNKPLRIRLSHIDCPELRKKQPYGNAAKQFVSERCFGKVVRIQHNNEFDRNKRLIGEVLLNNKINLNKELVKAGLAWHFKKYSKDEDYAKLELTARAARIGLWQDPDPTAPWNWRVPKKQ